MRIPVSNLKQLSLLKDARTVAASHHKGLLRQAVEIMRMKRRNSGLGASDYYEYRLYDPEYLGASRVEDYLGWREADDVPLIMNPRAGVTFAWDKFMFSVFATAHGLPVPRLRALYRPGTAPTTAIVDVTLDTRERLAAWLRTQDEWPIFAKPCYCALGVGCYCFTGYRHDDDMLLTRDGATIAVEHFASDIVGDVSRRRAPRAAYLRELGYLFQEVVHPHQRLVELLGTETISSVRVVLVKDESGADFVAAYWRMVLGDSDTDNVRDFDRGNVVGYVDLGTGRVNKVIDGVWPDARFVTHVPATRRPLEDFVLPDWPEALDVCRRAAGVFPLMRIQHWDVALTDQGPMLLEVNDMGSIGVQHGGSGLLTPRLKALLRRHGNPARHVLAKRLGK